MLLVGETGSGAGSLARALHKVLGRDNTTTIATYKGTSKKFLQTVAEGLCCAIRTDDDPPKDLTVEQLKEEILSHTDGVVMILPEAHRLPASIRYWLLDCMADGARIVCLAAQNLKKDIFLELLEIEIDLPSDERIRAVMRSEAQRYGLRLSESQLAALQPLAGRNPMLARKVVRAEALGLKQERPEHTQYLDIWPLVMAFFCLLGTMKFVGMGTNDRTLYLIGGVCMMVGLSLRYAGQVRGARRKLQ